MFVAKVAVMSKFATPMRASCPAVLCCKRFPEIKYECSPEGAGDVSPQRVPWLFYKYPCVFPQPRRRSFHLPKYSICQTVNNSVSGRDARAVTPRATPEKNVCPQPLIPHASLCAFCTCPDDAATNERVIVVYRRERLRSSPTTRKYSRSAPSRER